MAFRCNMHMTMYVFEVLELKSVIRIDLRPVFIALVARWSIGPLPSCFIVQRCDCVLCMSDMYLHSRTLQIQLRVKNENAFVNSQKWSANLGHSDRANGWSDGRAAVKEQARQAGRPGWVRHATVIVGHCPNCFGSPNYASLLGTEKHQSRLL